MLPADQIPPPFLFNPLKHHLGFQREYVNINQQTFLPSGNLSIIKELKHIGGSLMDVYSGALNTNEIINEISDYLSLNRLTERESFINWAGKNNNEYKTLTLSDNSVWILKYFDNVHRYIHPFPSRYSVHTFRIKANTLKSAVLYLFFVGKDYVTEEDLNTARSFAGLSPVKDIADTQAIMEMIEMLRD